MEAEWKVTVEPLCARIQEANTEAENLFPNWDSLSWKNWKPPMQFTNAAKFGQINGTRGSGREVQFALKLYW